MTVAELIEALSKLPPEMDVMYSDCDYGYVGIGKVEILNVPAHLFGEPSYTAVVILP